MPKPDLFTIQEACPFEELRASLSFEFLDKFGCRCGLKKNPSSSLCDTSEASGSAHGRGSFSDEEKPECDRICEKSERLEKLGTCTAISLCFWIYADALCLKLTYIYSS